MARRLQDRRVIIASPKCDRPIVGWDSFELLDPLLDEARHQVTELGNNYIGSEHLALAIVKFADPRLSALLRHCGATYKKVRDAVIELLRPEA